MLGEDEGGRKQDPKGGRKGLLAHVIQTTDTPCQRLPGIPDSGRTMTSSEALRAILRLGDLDWARDGSEAL